MAAARPGYCPPINTAPDACEMRYSVDIPLVGRDTVGVPIYQIVDDALKSATQQLPQYLPTFYQQVMPYVNQMRDSVWRDVEALVPDLLQEVLDEQVLPEVDRIQQNVIGEAEGLRDEILATVLASGAAALVALGVGIWYLKQR